MTDVEALPSVSRPLTIEVFWFRFSMGLRPHLLAGFHPQNIRWGPETAGLFLENSIMLGTLMVAGL